MKKCSDIMTESLVYSSPEDTVSNVAQLMKTEDIGPVLIIDNEESKRLVGIVTDRDLALKVVAEGRDPQTTKVEDVMTRKVIPCHRVIGTDGKLHGYGGGEGLPTKEWLLRMEGAVIA